MCFLNQSNKMKAFQMDNTKPSLKDMKIILNEIKGTRYRFQNKSVHVPNFMQIMFMNNSG